METVAYRPVDDDIRGRPTVFQGVVCAFQTLTAIAQTILAVTVIDGKTFPLFTAYTTNRVTMMPEVIKRGDIPIGYLVFSFLWLSALHHFALFFSTNLYLDIIARKCNYVRWFEYCLSAGIMQLAIAMLSGVTDTTKLYMIFLARVMTMLCGLLAEWQPSGQPPKLSLFILGLFPWVQSWLPVMESFIVGTSHNSPPAWVYAILVSMILLDSSFAVAELWWILYEGRKPNADYRISEFVFTTLSLTSKQLLAWLVFGGIASQGK